jgi:hypothetical protein
LSIPCYLSGGDVKQPQPSLHNAYIPVEILFQSRTAHPFGQNSSPEFGDGEMHGEMHAELKEAERYTMAIAVECKG